MNPRQERTNRGSLTPRAAVIALLAVITLSLVTACATLGAGADYLNLGSPVISPANDLVLLHFCRREDGCWLAAYVPVSGKTFLLEKPVDESWSTPAFSPDGKQIAFARGPVSSLSRQIAIMNADGTHLRTLTAGVGQAVNPSFSRDGRRLLYVRGLKTPETGGTTRKPVTNLDIYEIDLMSGSEKRLTNYSFYGMERASYYRDENTIIFSGFSPKIPDRYYRKGMEKERQDLERRLKRYLIYVIGRSQSAELPVPALEFGDEVFSPSVSLDGTRMTYLMRTNEMDGVKGKYNYDVFAKIGGATVRLTKMGSYIAGASIAPDGTWVVFRSDPMRRKQWELWRVNLDGSGLSQLKIAPEPTISRGLPR